MVVSFNVLGLSSNKECIKSLMYDLKPDLICMQETWLYQFQQFKANDISNNYSAYSKSVD